MDVNCIALNDSLLENETVILDNSNKTLLFKNEQILIEMTELQRRFICCLLSGIYKKNDIIRAVWFCNHETISDNNYYQMVFQCRSLFSRHGIPAGVIKTIPRFGVMLSFPSYKESNPIHRVSRNNSASFRERLKNIFGIINYKTALTITLLFYVGVIAGGSV